MAEHEGPIPKEAEAFDTANGIMEPLKQIVTGNPEAELLAGVGGTAGKFLGGAGKVLAGVMGAYNLGTGAGNLVDAIGRGDAAQGVQGGEKILEGGLGIAGTILGGSAAPLLGALGAGMAVGDLLGEAIFGPIPKKDTEKQQDEKRNGNMDAVTQQTEKIKAQVPGCETSLEYVSPTLSIVHIHLPDGQDIPTPVVTQEVN